MQRLQTKIPPLLILIFYQGISYGILGVFPGLRSGLGELKFIGLLCCIFGGTVAVHSFIKFLVKKTTVSPIDVNKSQTLVVTGFYRFSRNPMYLGMLLVLIGTICLLDAPLALITVPAFIASMNYLQILPEEKALSDTFGENYRQYLHRVRRWI